MISAYIKLLRPHQWLKNLMLFFPPLLAGKILLYSMPQLLYPFLVFSFASSATYVFNDIMDCQTDLLHHEKCFRPLPSGLITIKQAALVAVVAGGFSLATVMLCAPSVIGWLVAYLSLSFAYSLYLKHVVFLDILTISVLFLVRLMAGGAIFNIHVSSWLFSTVFLLALFLSAGKRLSELLALTSDAGSHRRVLSAYSPALLQGVLYGTAVTVLSAYAMYCVNHPLLFYSLPLCCYGLYRYIFRVKSGYDGDPTAALLKDPHMVIVGTGWLTLVIFGLYG